MIVTNENFAKTKIKHAKEILELLLSDNDEFDIICINKEIEFSPELPERISRDFGEVILFTLAEYTLSSARLENEHLVFEAGFGEENFGSVVSVPVNKIFQIMQQETPLFINVTAGVTYPEKEEKKNPFAMNPRNKKLLD